jgi:hypothetical protein
MRKFLSPVGIRGLAAFYAVLFGIWFLGSGISALAVTPEEFKLNSSTHRPFNSALDLSATTVTFATDQIPQAKVSGLITSLAGKVNNTGNETIAGVKTFTSKPVVPADAFPESAISNLVPDLAGKVNNTGNETIAGVKTFSSAPIVPAAAFPESAIINLTSDLAAKALDNTVVHITGNEDVGGTKRFTSIPLVPVASFPEAATVNLVTDLATKALDSAVVHNTGAETIAGVKTFTSKPIVPADALPESAISGLVPDLATKALDSAVVHNTGNETIAGNKTFAFGSTTTMAGALNVTDVTTLSGLTAIANLTAGTSTSGSITLNSLAAPGAPTVTHTGVPGSTTWAYRIVAKLADGSGSPGGTAGSTLTGNATLDTNNYNNLAWAPVAGVTGGYDIYRTIAGLSPSTLGKIANVSITAYLDRGAAGDGAAVPSSNTTGELIWLADNTSDIGATGANRPRDVNVARDVNVGGVLDVLGATKLEAGLNVTGATTGAAFSYTGNGTVGGTLGVTGATSGSSFGYTGNGTVGGTLGVTGATSGSSFSYTGNGTVGGTLGVVGAFTGAILTPAGGTLNVTGNEALSGNETVGGTLGVTGAITASSIANSGNGTVGGTLGVTGATTGSSAAYSGNATVGGTFGVTGATTAAAITASGTIVSAAQITNLDYIDVSRAPYSADMSGIADGTTALNNAIAAAVAAGRSLFIPTGTIKVSSTILITGTVRIFGNGKDTNGSKLLWAGTTGNVATDIIVKSLNVERGGGLENLTLDGGGNAEIALLVDGSCLGFYSNLRVTNYKTTGLKTYATSHTMSWNTFSNVSSDATTNGNSCIWISGTATGFNTAINTFTNIHVNMGGGVRVGIRLGCADSNSFNDTWIFTTNPANTGIYADATEATGNQRPNGNFFYRTTATPGGGWVQLAAAANFITPNFIYGYGKSNGEPDPVVNGTSTLIWLDENGVFTGFKTVPHPTAWDIPSTVNGGNMISDFTVTGVAATDTITITPSQYYGLIGISYLTTNTVRCVYYNLTGTTQDPAPLTFNINVTKQ